MSVRVQHGEVTVGQKILYVNGLWATVLEIVSLGGVIKMLVRVGEGIKALVREITVNALTMGIILKEV